MGAAKVEFVDPDVGYDPVRCAIHSQTLQNIDKKMDRVVELLDGNGKPGMRIELDRMQQEHTRQKKTVWLLFAGLITMMGDLLYGYLTRKP